MYYADFDDIYYYDYTENYGATARIDGATTDDVYTINITKEYLADYEYNEIDSVAGHTPVFATFELSIDLGDGQGFQTVCQKQKGQGDSTDFTVTVQNCAVVSC